MRNRNIIQNAGLVTLLLVGSVMAAPIPASQTGLGQLVAVDSHDLNILNGGAFGARVGDPLLNPGVSTTFWCIDIENFIDAGQASAQYIANVILVGDTTAQASYVRKGTDTAWEDGQSFTTQQRYTAAAYLVEKIIAGNSGYSNDDLQRAIWRLTDLAVGSETAADSSWENAAYMDAKGFIAANGTTAGTWATVSGVAGANGALSVDDRRQTFLVQVESSTVPEPGTYALMGAGLVLIASLRRRRAN